MNSDWFLALSLQFVVTTTNYERGDDPRSSIIRVRELFYEIFLSILSFYQYIV